MENNNFDDEKKTILIVDDEQKIVDLLVHNLTREGYNTCLLYTSPSPRDCS